MTTKIVAEIGNNHMGSRELMEAMIKSLAHIGVDAVKFQSFKADKLRKDYPNYEQEYMYYKQHELSEGDHVFLMQKCMEYGIEFITTAFDLDTVDMLKTLGLKTVKIASPDATSWSLIDKCLDNFDKVIISTGMHSVEELNKLMSYISIKDRHLKTTLLHCVSEYPASLHKVNMERMNYIRNNHLGYGFSDHTLGTEASKYAIALGAYIL